ncbi:hypothetical protein AVEN_106436-1 [Araneus ventricosus]|uniref:RNase H type-1 domain-containing protein n=1 Tax=Araneus ventricosus TaxID=182803 RepID=A0A4Y2ASU2_ARAVE|nr:hypothetical protein AVEN_106436-1 [Araneus ventricosus]
MCECMFRLLHISGVANRAVPEHFDPGGTIDGVGIARQEEASDKEERLDDNIFEVYMDGSKIADGVGFSVRILNKEIQQKTICHELETNNAVFQPELAALGVDTDWAVENNTKINITDSKSSIDAL